MKNVTFSLPINSMITAATAKYAQLNNPDGSMAAWIPRNSRPDITITSSANSTHNITLNYGNQDIINITGVPDAELQNTLSRINTLT